MEQLNCISADILNKKRKWYQFGIYKLVLYQLSVEIKSFLSFIGIIKLKKKINKYII